MPSRHIIPLALAISLAAPAAASAQSSAPSPARAPRTASATDHFSVQGGLLVTSFSIDDKDQGEAAGGGGIHLQGRYTRDRVSLALGLESTVHDVKDNSEDLSHVALYVEPRLELPQLLAGSSQQMVPYVSARLGRSRYAVEFQGEDLEARGWLYGVGGGVLYELNTGLRLDVGLSFSHAGFGNAEADGDEIPKSKFGANMVGLRAGVGYSFGSR